MARPSRRSALARPPAPLNPAEPSRAQGKARPHACAAHAARRLAPGHHPARHQRRGRCPLRRSRSDARPAPLRLSQRRRREPRAHRTNEGFSEHETADARLRQSRRRYLLEPSRQCRRDDRQLIQRHHGSGLLRPAHDQRRHSPTGPRARPQRDRRACGERGHS